MAIQRWDPLKDLVRLQQRMNDLFEDALSRSGVGRTLDAPAGRTWRPPVDLQERADRYVLLADIPGVNGDEIEINVEEGILSLRGERRAAQDVPQESYLRSERPHGPFLVQLTLPPSVDPGGIQASHRSGVIEVTLPKREEPQERSLRIDVS